jgi:hypothetical protein
MKEEEFRMNRHMLNGILRGASLALLLGIGSLAAYADSFFTDQSAWVSALAGAPTTINFEGLAPNNTTDPQTYIGSGPGANTTVGGVNFAIGAAGADNMMFIAGDGNYLPVSVLTVGSTSLTGSPSDLLITLPSAVTALGFDFASLYVGDTATITLSDGSVQTVALSGDTQLAFFGVTAPGGINSVDISLAPGTYDVVVPDFSYGTANTTPPVPEPSSFLLLGSGLVSLAGMVRRRIATRA